jgi:hypothetical protein
VDSTCRVVATAGRRRFQLAGSSSVRNIGGESLEPDLGRRRLRERHPKGVFESPRVKRRQIGDLALGDALQDVAAYLGRTGRIDAAAGEQHPVG